MEQACLGIFWLHDQLSGVVPESISSILLDPADILDRVGYSIESRSDDNVARFIDVAPPSFLVPNSSPSVVEEIRVMKDGFYHHIPVQVDEAVFAVHFS